MEQAGGSILKNNVYLYLTEFFAGMSVMAVELGASRLLAPYFSSSQIVWTIIIGTIMIAMALGNLWGGRSADKDPDPGRLYKRLLIAAVWIALIPVLGKYIILAISAVLVFAVSSNFLVIAAFAACMVLFVYPLFLLGTVTPSLVKYTMQSMADSGRTVGRLEAFNTIGSILGTFLPTFVTIPAVGTSITFLIFAGVLLALALLYFLTQKKNRGLCAGAAAVFLACVLLGHSSSFAFWEDDLVYEGESVYNYLQVKEDGDSVILSTNVLFGVQSIYKKSGGLTGMYYDTALAAPVMAGVPQKQQPRILILGMGSGTYAGQCGQYFPQAVVEGVEIDQKITQLAGEYFNLSPEVQVATYDGRAYLQAVEQEYDVILVDAYQDITIPFQMSSVEFFTLVRDHLTEDGVMVVNMNMRAEGEGNINQYLADTIAAVFGCVYTADVDGMTNRELFASAIDPAQALQSSLPTVQDEQLRAALEQVLSRLQPYQSTGLLLTDDKAPVELLGMRVIDSLIQNELGYYRRLFAQQGIAGVLNDLA